MDINSQITIRTKKLGVLIRDARLAERRSIKECAVAMGIKPALFRAYEEGRRAPSLPELEVLVYYLRLGLNHFWGNESLSVVPPPTEPINLPLLLNVRQHKIGALLRQERNNASLSLKALSEQTGISSGRLKAYELGERPITLPELEAILAVLGSRIENFFDQSGPVGKWMTEQNAVKKFLELPENLQNFVCQPVNHPYLELAMKLSEMSKDRLRSVAEGLLDITL
jgi:transcriptional regulator with XRE-family HTH domain